jgi:uncharacterized SAM-binding protein YcdF (DUF218 family)
MSRNRRRVGAILVLLTVLTAPLWGRLFITALNSPLRSLGSHLTADDRPQSADYIVVLNGKLSIRGEHGANLYRKGYAPRVLIARTAREESTLVANRSWSPAVVLARRLAREGVAESAIEIIPGEVESTIDEARALRRYLESSPADRVLVATTDYHVARARWVIRKVLEGLPVQVIVVGSPDNNGVGPENWWKSGIGRRTYGAELLKWFASILQLTAERLVGRG